MDIHIINIFIILLIFLIISYFLIHIDVILLLKQFRLFKSWHQQFSMQVSCFLYVEEEQHLDHRERKTQEKEDWDIKLNKNSHIIFCKLFACLKYYCSTYSVVSIMCCFSFSFVFVFVCVCVCARASFTS